jgi:hypothetical protein
MAGGRKSGSQRDRAAFFVAAGRSVTESARESGVSRRTLTAWLTEEPFRQRVRELRDRLLERTVGRLTGAGVKAVKTLVRLTGAGVKAEVQRAAAAALLASLFKGTDMLDIAKRLEALEEAERLRGKK